MAGRLTNSEIVIVSSLARRCAAPALPGVSLAGWQRARVVPLWRPTKWSGDRWWIVALIGEVDGDAEKFGCLTREILGEAT